MAMVMITCPITNRQVFTGIETDPASIALVPPINTRMTCPACGNVHTWSVLDAELACDAIELPTQASPEVQSGLRRLAESANARTRRPPRPLPRAS